MRPLLHPEGHVARKRACGVVTLTVPVVAPAGTAVVISELEATLNVSRRAVKGDAGRAGQIGSQNL